MKNLQNLVRVFFKSPVSIFVLIFLFLLLLLPWRGFYLLNDSYVYEWNVRNIFLNNHQLHPFTGPTTLFQTYLGYIIYTFSKDPALLRLSTLIFSFLGVYYFYKILALKFKKWVSFVFSLLLLFNPLVFNLSFTFMSDIYYFSFLIISYYYYLVFFKTYSTSKLLVANLFLTFSFLSRQSALISLVSMVLIFIVKRVSIKYYVYFLLPLCTFIWYQFFYTPTLAYSQGSLVKTFSLWSDSQFIISMLSRAILSLYYIGFFIFPITFSYLINSVKSKDIFLKKSYFSVAVTFIVVFVIFVYYWLSQKILMFYLPNVLSYAGFNPQNLSVGIKQTIFVNSPVRSGLVYTLISMISLSGFVLVLISYPKKIQELIKNDTFLVLSVPTLLTLLALLVFRDYYDRYLIIVIPVLIYTLLYLLEGGKKIVKSFFLIFTFLLILFSLMWEHDYLSFNKKIWQEAMGVSKNHKEVKATFEFNNYWYLDDTKNSSDILYLSNKEYLPKTEDYSYIFGYINVPPFCTLKEYTYFSLISPKYKGNVVLMGACKNN